MKPARRSRERALLVDCHKRLDQLDLHGPMITFPDDADQALLLRLMKTQEYVAGHVPGFVLACHWSGGLNDLCIEL
jgi:hypothetical protein